jgi:hypothetical protein
MPKNRLGGWTEWRTPAVLLSPPAPLCFSIAADTVVRCV